jgi:tRNA (L-threonylcarbamoyladenosine(37)-C2) methyltransferase TrmO-like protein
MKRRIPYALTLALALLLSGIGLAQKASPAKPSVPKGWSFSFPDGDTNTGKQLYVKMECYACHTDRLRRDQIGPLQVKPRRLVNRGLKLEDLPLLGVFALDSPTRPNPIGLTLVRLLGRQGRFLNVSGLDYFDATPILDIKGYRPTYRVGEFDVPDWYKKLQDARGHI